MAYDCRDVAIILGQLKFKKSQSTNTFYNERNKFLKRCLFLKAKGKPQSNHGYIHYVYMTSLIFDVIGRSYPKEQE